MLTEVKRNILYRLVGLMVETLKTVNQTLKKIIFVEETGIIDSSFSRNTGRLFPFSSKY